MSSKAALPADFESCEPPERAAMLWADAMRAMGGLGALHASEPGFHGLTWEEFARQRRGGDEDIDSRVDDWIDLAASRAPALAFALSQCSWCYFDDGELADRGGLFMQGDGIRVSIFPSAAPLKNELRPFSAMVERWLGPPCAPGTWRLGEDEGSAVGAMRAAYAQLSSMGLSYDARAQRLMRFTDYVDMADPVDRKLEWIVPAFAADRERRELDGELGQAEGAGRRGAL